MLIKAVLGGERGVNFPFKASLINMRLYMRTILLVGFRNMEKFGSAGNQGHFIVEILYFLAFPFSKNFIT